MTHENDRDEMAGYRPVSPLAVAALVCGAAAVLVLVTPLAAMLPLIAVALAVAALADLRRAEGKRAGRPLALLGLALALGFTAQALTGSLVDDWIARRRALAAASAWIDAVSEERLTDAIGMCGPGGFTLPHELAVASEPPTPTVREDAFRSTPAVAAIMACAGTRPTVTTVRRVAANEAVWTVAADLGACGDQPGSLQINVMPRTETAQGGSLERWLVVGLAVER
jgi:hypothetical protein